MAENKKSFVLYTDLISTFEELEDVEAGRLIKHLLRYVNDANPEPPDRLTKLVFEPIKQQLKRDLQRWEGIKDKRSEAGKASAEARRLLKEQNSTKSTSVKSVEQTLTNSTVSVNDNVNDTVNVNVNDSVINKEKDKKKKAASPSPTKKARTTEDFKEIARISFQNNECQFSNNFKIQWLKLIQSKKWIKKEQSAIDASLKKLMRYDEVFSQLLVENAIAGEYQGVTFADTDTHYEKYQKQSNGNSKNLTTADKTISRNNMVELARSILSGNAATQSY